MFRRVIVSSQSDMETQLLNFVSYVTNIPVSDNMKIPAADNYNTLWFCRDSVAGGISAWATDKTEDVTYPWQAFSTYGLAAKYALDMDRQELDIEKTNAAKAKKKEEIYKKYQELYEAEKKAGFVGCPVSKVWLDNALKELEEDDSYNVYQTKTYRCFTTNVFHVGGVLKFSSVGSSNPVLDMHYNDDVFSFVLYSYNSKPSIARHLIIGCYRSYQPQSQRVFIMSNAWRYKSDYKHGSYNDCFFLERGYKTLPDVTADLADEDVVKVYNSEIMSMAKILIDNQLNRTKNMYSVNGVRAPLHWHVKPVYLPYWDISSFAIGEIRTPKLCEWQYCVLHSTYEGEISTVGADYASINSYVSQSYSVYDSLRQSYKQFSSSKRSAVTDTVNKTPNNNSLIMPLIFYCQREPQALDLWSAVGQCDIINYVNMYNMYNGRIYQTTYDRNVPEFATYDLYKRRAESTKTALKQSKKPKDSVTETWGYSGYVGIAVKVDRHSKADYVGGVSS